jgi:hypothetical protein
MCYVVLQLNRLAVVPASHVNLHTAQAEHVVDCGPAAVLLSLRSHGCFDKGLHATD